MSQFDANSADWSQNQRSPGGSRVYAYSLGDYQSQPVLQDEALAQAVRMHVEEHIGPVHGTRTGVVRENAWVDILQITPTLERPFWTLITSGVSSMAMNVPEDIDVTPYIEFIMFLPADWPIATPEPSDEWEWPLHLLSLVSHMVHSLRTWNWAHHTISVEGIDMTHSPFSGALIDAPQEEEHASSLWHGGKHIQMLQVVPLMPDEMDYKLSEGPDALIQLFVEHGTAVVDPTRSSVVAQQQSLRKSKKRFSKSEYKPYQQGLFHSRVILDPLAKYAWFALADHFRIDALFRGEYQVVLQRFDEDTLELMIANTSDEIIYWGRMKRESSYREDCSLLVPALLPMPEPQELSIISHMVLSSHESWVVSSE